MLEIKVCGINDLTAMEAALAAAADMIGLVFFPPSPRAVLPAAGAKLAARGRGRALIAALVVDADDALLQSIANEVAPDLFQLHGKETPARVAEIRQRFGRPIAKALPVETAADLKSLADYAAVADRILFDARPPRDATRPGGHGRAFDWHLLAHTPRVKPIMLSGGLDPDNVARAIEILRPDAVDVSSGVEQSPGVKDPVKIRRFIENARTAAAAFAEQVS